MDTNNDSMETKIRYLEMIQSVINRMASNSFLLKGWTVTLIVGLFVFANKADQMDPKYVLLALIPALFFWLLDGFFIYQEWLFRKLYEHAITLDNNNIDFSMKPGRFTSSDINWRKGVFSKTLVPFYLPMIVLIIICFSFGLIK